MDSGNNRWHNFPGAAAAVAVMHYKQISFRGVTLRGIAVMHS